MANRWIPLRMIAHARSGDKGSDCNIGVIPYNTSGYHFLKERLSEEVVRNFFSSLSPKKVIRYELPNLEAFNFHLIGVLSGGASRSLRIDSQGKALGQAILEMQLSVPQELLEKIFP